MLGIVANDLADPFFATLLKGVETEARQAGMQVLAACGHHDAEQEEAAIRSLLSRRCDALIVHSKDIPDQQLLDLLSECPVAVVVNREIPEIADRCIWFDNLAAGYMATKHLLAQGHQNIAWLGRNQNITDNVDRYIGFCNALGQAGIDHNKAYKAFGEATVEGGYQLAYELIRSKSEVTAIMAYNDAMAAGCLRALHELNYKLPDDCSVMGIDDVILGLVVYPQLTTVNYPVEDIGRTAVKKALALLADQQLEMTNHFSPKVVIRGSVASLRKSVLRKSGS
nr:substrate-binding domain-containing protein [Sansalvadorimonas sp. 2012CJ34-2]